MEGRSRFSLPGTTCYRRSLPRRSLSALKSQDPTLHVLPVGWVVLARVVVIDRGALVPDLVDF